MRENPRPRQSRAFRGPANERARPAPRMEASSSTPASSPSPARQRGGSLFGERASPGAWTYANDAGEHSRQVTLICEAAGQGHIRQRQSAIAQLPLGYGDAMRQKPVMRCCSHGVAKRAREMTHRQTALSRDLLERHTTIEVGAENFLGALYLPCRESTPDRWRQRPHAAIGVRDMYPERQENVVDKQLVHLVGTAEHRQHGLPKIENRGVVYSHGLMVQLANSRRVGIFGD